MPACGGEAAPGASSANPAEAEAEAVPFPESISGLDDELQADFEEPLLTGQPVEQADAQSLFGFHFSVGVEQLLGLGQPYDRGQVPGSDCHAIRDPREAEGRGLAADPQITGTGELGATAVCVAVDSSDGGLGEVRQSSKQASDVA